MVWRISSPIAGTQPIATTSTVRNHPLGTIVSAYDPTSGWGEFIYLEGVANTAIGHGVTYHAATFLTALASAVGGVTTPVAIAMSANVASQYGWYQISGRATIKKASALSMAAGLAFGVTSGLAVVLLTGKRLEGAVTGAIMVAGSPSAVVLINRPSVSGVAEA